MTPARAEERRGPRPDAPEQAIEGFLRATGLRRDQLELRAEKKGEVFYAVIRHPGRPAAEVIAEAVAATIRSFPWPKSMRWGSGTLRWVRPLQSILCILTDEHGSQVVPVEIDGIAAADLTRGHRFHAPDPFRVTSFEDYEARLRAARVILDPAERAERIEHDAKQLAFAQGMEVVEDAGLLAEVTGLVEWPVVMLGEIGERFLDLPPEVLRVSMKEHQKFFSVRNPATGRIERFVTVANIEATDGGAQILAGNRRVLAARLDNARFFWEADLRKVKGKGIEGIEEMAKPLGQMVFHAELGTQAERVARIAPLAREIAPKVGADPELAEQAARVAKADLASEMVFEFPELQGVMGRYYAKAAGLPDAVAEASEAHYRPLGPNDAVPTEPVAVAVALADKLDMLTGFWTVNEKPTGSKDPFALRRAALGVIRVALENNIRLNCVPFIDSQVDRILSQMHERRLKSAKLKSDPTVIATGKALKDFKGEKVSVNAVDLLSFLADRLKVALRDQGIRHDVIQACFELGGQDDLVLLVNRVRALQDFLATEDGEHLLTGYRRAANIVEIEERRDGVEYSYPPDAKFAELPEERALFAALNAAEPAIAAALEAEDFAAAMAAMAKLRPVIDAFFDKVTVNAENPIVRRNRLCLLNRIRKVMRQVAVWEAIEG
jgi:glycyl-tRNA synthetase beta chain